MSNSKFGIRDVLDLQFHDENGLLFTIYTARSTSFTFDAISGINILKVEDALVDMKLFVEIMNGKYHGKQIRVTGRGTVRNVDDGKDRETTLLINIATIVSYKLKLKGEVAVPVIEIAFPLKDSTGFGNLNVTVL